MLMTIATILSAAILGVFTLVAITFFIRGTPVKRLRVLEDDGDWVGVSEDRFCQSFSILTNTTFHDDNAIRIIANGEETYPALWDALESAEDLITWHVFWFKPGELADQLSEILVRKARDGVTVLLLYDWFGSRGIPESYYQRLREAGVEVRPFREPKWNQLYKFQQRMHSRVVTIDGKVGFTGGFAISDEWSGNGRSENQWRDTSVRVEGHIVQQLQSAFASNWAEACGELLVGKRAFPPIEGAAGTTTAGLMYDAPSLGSTNAERFFMLAIGGATERLYITNPYFIPDHHFRRALIDAVERGVDVRVLTPGVNNDRMSTYHAARASYEELLRGGVRIYHYRPTMVHAKTLVADGCWASVGTINFDNRSMVLNDEVAVVMQDADCGRKLEEMFRADLEYADEVDLEEIESRGITDRAKEVFYRAFAPIL